MGKKRQIDFQKTKLRVGRTLPKGRNVTDTSFKTRKIHTRDQLKSVSGEVSLKDILNYLGHNNVSVKKENLSKLVNYILDNKDSLVIFFPDVLKRIGPMLMDSDRRVRTMVIEVLHTVLRLLSEAQVSCFFTSLTSYMQCMLTHCDTDVRRDSLELLDRVLGTHPLVFCRASNVLHGLLNLISSATQKGQKRRLNEHISSTLSSQQMRARVLSCILAFLEILFEAPPEEDEDEREVYWDTKKPLYQPLYLRGGTSPVPLEVVNADNRSSTNTREFKDFVSDLVPLLCDMIKGEIPARKSHPAETPTTEMDLGEAKLSDNLFSSSVISDLNLVVQILCCVGEWMLQQKPFDDAKDKKFKNLITKIVCDHLFSYFPYEQLHETQKNSENTNIKGANSLLLNLGVCHIYCLFVLHSGTGACHAEAMVNYLGVLYNGCSRLNEKMITLITKIHKPCMNSPDVLEVYKNGLLLGIYGILDSHKHFSCVKQIYSFFMDLTLDYQNKHLLESEAMRTWFNLILKEILIMVESNSVDKKFFKYVRQICARKYPYFIDLLNRANPDNFLDLLKYEYNEELHLTVTQMILCLDQPCNLLDGLIDVISDPAFNQKSAIRIIRQLHGRFLGAEVPHQEKLYFLKFVLNLGCDSLSLVDPSCEVITPDMLKSVMEGCKYNLRPSTKWERHLGITEACLECLPCYLEKDYLVLHVLKFLNTVLYQYSIIPIHSAIAFLKLRKVAYEIERNEDLMGSYGELLFSSLLYVSVMLSEENKREALKPYALTELKNSLGLENEDVNIVLHIIKMNVHSFGENEMYHVLRMLQFLIHARILKYEDRNEIFPILETVNSTYQRSHLVHPLWRNICKFLRFV